MENKNNQQNFNDHDQSDQIIISKNIFTKEKVLGKGTYGRVFLVRDQEGRQFAMKEMSNFNNYRGLNVLYLREVSILKDLNHANIIQLRFWQYAWTSKRFFNPKQAIYIWCLITWT